MLKIGISKFEIYFIFLIGLLLGFLKEYLVIMGYTLFVGIISPIIDYKIIWKYQHGDVIEELNMRDAFLLHIPLVISCILGSIIGFRIGGIL